MKAFINEDEAITEKFTDAEFESAVEEMSNDNQIMVTDDMLFII